MRNMGKIFFTKHLVSEMKDLYLNLFILKEISLMDSNRGENT